MLPSRQTLPLVDRGDSTGPNVRNVVIVGATGTEKIISEQLEGNGEVVCKTSYSLQKCVQPGCIEAS